MPDTPTHLFTTCQVGAEGALKAELGRTWPGFRFAFSRPGFVTFKLPNACGLADDFDLRSVFARTYGFCLGKIEGENAEQMADELWALVGDRPVDVLHVWQRDAALPGEGDFEPGRTTLADEMGTIIVSRRREAGPKPSPLDVNRRAHQGEAVLDCVLVEPNQWWIGRHRAASFHSRWPGGVCQIELPPEVVSRAYLKTAEALHWSQLPIQAGDRVVELGAAPGGSCQALLDRGLIVTGVDPAEMDESVLEHPDFTHLQMRSVEVRRRDFRDVRWLISDISAAPAYTLDAVEAIVTHETVNIRGMLLTLKLSNWGLADEIRSYVSRVRGWGFEYVRVRQLAFNRREMCLAAMRSRSMRRGQKRPSRARSPR